MIEKASKKIIEKVPVNVGISPQQDLPGILHAYTKMDISCMGGPYKQVSHLSLVSESLL